MSKTDVGRVQPGNEKTRLLNNSPVAMAKGGDEKSPNGKIDMEPESGKAKVPPYPKAVFLILANEFCERFSFYGMRAVLVLFLTNQLLLKENQATAWYHVFVFLCYFMPIPGAIVSDSWLGKFNTIFYLSIVYIVGLGTLSVTAIPTLYPDDATQALKMAGPMLGLFLIAVGTGGIKPCVSSFGGDQFLRGQEKQQKAFFSIFYMSINLGSLLSIIITPFLRDNVECFDDECFTAAFGVPAALLIVALVFFLFGKPYYKIYPSDENVFLKVCKCIAYAFTHNGPKPPGRTEFMYRASDKYGEKFVEEVIGVGRVIIMMLPLPFFWALFEQSGSRWTLMATKMNGLLCEDCFGSGESYVIKPDQIQVVNPIMIVFLVPVFEAFVYPCFDKLHIPNTPLQRTSAGLFIEGLSFVLAGVVQIYLDETLLDPPVSQTRTAVTNLGACADLHVGFDEPINLNGSLGLGKSLPYSGDFDFGNYSMEYACGGAAPSAADVIFEKERDDGSMHRVLAYRSGTAGLGHHVFAENPLKPRKGRILTRTVLLLERSSLGAKILCTELANTMCVAGVRVVYKGEGSGENGVTFWTNRSNTDWKSSRVLLVQALNDSKHEAKKQDEPNELTEIINYGKYAVEMRVLERNGSGALVQASATKLKDSVDLAAGNSYDVFLYWTATTTTTTEGYAASLGVVNPASDFSIMWQIPMYFVATVGEVLVSVTCLQFAYSQAPLSMKSVVTSIFLLTNAFGNLIVVLIAELDFFEKQWMEFFLFAGLQMVAWLVFSVLAVFYKYMEYQRDEAGDEVVETSEGEVVYEHLQPPRGRAFSSPRASKRPVPAGHHDDHQLIDNRQNDENGYLGPAYYEDDDAATKL